MACIATNGATSSGHVAITAHDQAGTEIDGYDFCGSGDLAPGASCYYYVPNDTWASCGFQVTGKIRAGAEVRDNATTRPLFAVPATK
jgi:hypothetical protein